MNMTIERGKIGVRSRQSARGLPIGLLGLACLAVLSGAASAQTYIEFTAPGSGTAFPLSINTDEAIAGYYFDVSGFNHGFVGTTGGTITTFDVSGAFGTTADSINSAGVIAGHWSDVNAVNHGFVRSADGTITSFEAPNAGTNIHQGTLPESINTAGVITGYCSCKGQHAFVRSASGTITTFDAPSASTSENNVYVQGTFALSTTEWSPYYVDSSDGFHGFVRSASGTITTIDAPGAGTFPLTGYPLGTKALSINDDRVIVGYYIDPNEVYHGFMVSASGSITTFNAPGAGTTKATGTFPTSINNNGVIVGYYNEVSGYAYQGFQLTP
jgi:hypothetical protein